MNSFWEKNIAKMTGTNCGQAWCFRIWKGIELTSEFIVSCEKKVDPGIRVYY